MSASFPFLNPPSLPPSLPPFHRPKKFSFALISKKGWCSAYTNTTYEEKENKVENK